MQANYTFNCNRDTAIELLPPNNRVKFLYQVEVRTKSIYRENKTPISWQSLKMNSIQLKFCGECLYNHAHNFDACTIFQLDSSEFFSATRYIKDKMAIASITRNKFLTNVVSIKNVLQTIFKSNNNNNFHNLKFQIGTTFYWALNQLMKKPKSLQKPAKQLKADGIHLTAKHLQKTNASQPAKGSALGQKSEVDVTQKQRTLESQFAKGSAQKTKSTVADIPATTSLKKTIDPPSKQGGQKRKMDPYDTAKFSQPTAKPKVDDNQRNKKGTARKGWKGYVEMSREEFERDLALKEMDEYRALPHKRGRKPKIDSIYVV